MRMSKVFQVLLMMLFFTFNVFSEDLCKRNYKKSSEKIDQYKDAHSKTSFASRYNLSEMDPFYGLDSNWVEFLKYEREKNVYLLNAKNIEKDELSTFVLLKFKVPRDQNKNDVFTSKQLNRNEKLVLFDSETETETISYFVKATSKKEVAYLIEKFGIPTKELLAVKLSGRSSILIWDPLGSFTPIVLKMDSYSNRRMKQGVIGTDILDELNSSEFRILKEKSVVTVRVGNFYNQYLLRDVSEITASFSSARKIYPLHGFIGSDLIEQMASLMKINKEEWIKREYLPALAKKIANQNFKLGVYLGNHTQNTLIELDPLTGKITDFVFKDIQDMMVDNYVFDQSANLNLTKSIDMVLNKYFQDNSYLARKRGKEIGIHFALYDFQSIISLTQDPVLSRKYVGIYLKNYIEEVDKLTNRKLNLSDESKSLLENLEYGLEANTIESSKLSHLQSVAARILNNVYEQYIRSEFYGLNMENFKYDQGKLYSLFYLFHLQGKIIQTSPEASITAKYGVYGNRLILLDPKKQKVIAVSIRLSDKQISEIKEEVMGSPNRLDVAKIALKKMENVAKTTKIELEVEAGILKREMNELLKEIIKVFKFFRF